MNEIISSIQSIHKKTDSMFNASVPTPLSNTADFTQRESKLLFQDLQFDEFPQIARKLLNA